MEEYVEPRLIDANAFLKHWNKEYRHRFSCDIFKVALANFPATEAKPIIHAHWEDMYGGKYANPRYRCSACKEKALWKNVQDELLSWHEVQALTPYCPHCGAEMDI